MAKTKRNRPQPKVLLRLAPGARIPNWVYRLEGGPHDPDWVSSPCDRESSRRSAWRRLMTIHQAVAILNAEESEIEIYSTRRDTRERFLGSFPSDRILFVKWQADPACHIKHGEWQNPANCPWCVENHGVKLGLTIWHCIHSKLKLWQIPR